MRYKFFFICLVLLVLCFPNLVFNAISDPPIENDNWWIYEEKPNYTIYKAPSFNWDKFWNVFKDHALWKLEGWNPISEQWVDATSLLNINRNYIEFDTCKISLNFTTPDNGISTDWRFTLGVDYAVRSHINKSGNHEYTLSYEAWGEHFNVSFNWSDMLQYSGLIYSHGIKNIGGDDVFWFRVRRNNIPPNFYVEIDPEYSVYSETNIFQEFCGQRKLVRQSNGTLWCTYRANSDIHVAYSSTGGRTWVDTEISPVVGWYPSLAVDSNDTVHLMYGAGDDVRYVNSTDWTDIRDVHTELNNGFFAPTIAVDSNDNLHVAFYFNKIIGQTNTDIRYFNSSDNGDTWSTPFNLTNETDASDNDWELSIAINSSDSIHLVFQCEGWNDNNQDTTLHMKSDDGGLTWSDWEADVVMSSVTDSEGAPCLVINDDDDLIVVGWDEDSDVFYRYNKSGSNKWVDGDATEEIDQSGRAPSVSVTENNTIHTLIYHWNDYDIIHYRNTSEDNNWDYNEKILTGTYEFSQTLCTQYPVVDGNKTNRPYRGYAFISEKDGTDIIYYASDDLRWTINYPPVISSPNPSSGSHNASVPPTVNVTVSDEDGNDTTCNFYLSSDNSSFDLVQTNNSVTANTSISCILTSVNVYQTTYYWKVTADDNLDNSTSLVYSFETTPYRTLFFNDTFPNENWVNTDNNITFETGWENFTYSADAFSGFFGKNDTGATSSSLGSYAYAGNFIANYTGNIKNFTLDLDPSATTVDVKIALLLYSDKSLIREGERVDIGSAVRDWYTVELDSVAPVTKGVRYILGARANGACNIYRDACSVAGYYSAYADTITYANFMEDPWTPAYSYTNRNYSIYATYELLLATQDGYIISDEIFLPSGYSWDEFYSEVNDTGNCSFAIIDPSDNDFNISSGLVGNGDDISGVTNKSIMIYGNFSDSSVNMGSWNITWAISGNVAPTLSGQHPYNSSTNGSLTPDVFVICTDADSDTMNATFSSNSSGTWKKFGLANTSISSGTNITQNFPNATVYNQIYYWNLSCSDGMDNWINETYHFTTISEPNYPVNFSNPNPTNNSFENAINLTWNVTMIDDNGDTFNWTIECSNGNNSNANDDTNGSKTLSIAWLDYFTAYTVFVNATDGNLTTNETFVFTTINLSIDIISVTDEFPSNNTNTAPTQPYLYVTINHSTGETMNISWYYGASEGAENTLIATDVNISNSTQNALFLEASSYNTEYFWRVMVNDGEGTWINETFIFNTTGTSGSGRTTTLWIIGVLFGIFGIMSLFLGTRRKEMKKNKKPESYSDDEYYGSDY